MQCVDGVRAAGVEPAARLGGGGGETSCMRRWRGLRARELGSWGAVVHMRGRGVRGRGAQAVQAGRPRQEPTRA